MQYVELDDDFAPGLRQRPRQGPTEIQTAQMRAAFTDMLCAQEHILLSALCTHLACGAFGWSGAFAADIVCIGCTVRYTTALV